MLKIAYGGIRNLGAKIAYIIGGEDSRRKTFDVARIFSLQQKDGFSFTVVDRGIVSKLAYLKDVEVMRDSSLGRVNGDQRSCCPIMCVV
jgi:hypothetical protein